MDKNEDKDNLQDNLDKPKTPSFLPPPNISKSSSSSSSNKNTHHTCSDARRKLEFSDLAASQVLDTSSKTLSNQEQEFGMAKSQKIISDVHQMISMTMCPYNLLKMKNLPPNPMMEKTIHKGKLEAWKTRIEDIDMRVEEFQDFSNWVAGQRDRGLEEDPKKFRNLKNLIGGSARGNIEQLSRKLIKLKSESVKGSIIETKIHVLLNEDYRKQLSFLECLKMFGKSDSDEIFKSLNSLKIRAIDHGKHISILLIHLLFLMTKDRMGMAKIQVLKETLKWVSEGENSAVIQKFHDLVDTAEKKIGKMEVDGIDGNNGQDLEEDISDKFILELMNEILKLEKFWIHKAFPGPGILEMKDSFPIVVAEMEECEKRLKDMYPEMQECVANLSAFKCNSKDDLTTGENADYMEMKSLIKQVWDQFEESEFRRNE